MNRKGFTLVELIVVITILAILWTIAFISLQWYAANARDSRRISDMGNIKKSLELFTLQTEKYPLPDNGETVTYSWEIVWTQWTLWDNVVEQLSRNLKKKPLDPITEEEYIYSTTENKWEYEVLAIYEWWIANNTILNQTHAVDTWYVKVDGTYNQLYTETSTYTIPVPSLITSEELPLVLDATNIRSQVVTGQSNRPARVNTTIQTGSLDIALSAYAWKITETSTNQEKIDIITAVQNAYTGTTLATQETYSNLLSQTSTGSQVSFANTVSLGEPEPIPIAAAPVETPPLIDEATCTSSGWFWVDSAWDMPIWTEQWDWFCISQRIGGFNFDNGFYAFFSWNGWGNSTGNSYKWWDTTPIGDSGNYSPQNGQTRRLDSESGYTCKPLWTASSDYDTTDGNGDTLHNRMKRLITNKLTFNSFLDVDWIVWAIPPNNQVIPALFLSDCIDWQKDLTTDMNYIHSDDSNIPITYAQYTEDAPSTTVSDIYRNRQKYLLAWTQRSWSHLPSEFSSFATNESWKGEYELACEANKLTDADDDIDNKWIFVAAIGHPWGSFWNNNARWIGYNGCSDAYASTPTGMKSYNRAVRFVIRP